MMIMALLHMATCSSLLEQLATDFDYFKAFKLLIT